MVSLFAAHWLPSGAVVMRKRSLVLPPGIRRSGADLAQGRIGIADCIVQRFQRRADLVVVNQYLNAHLTSVNRAASCASIAALNAWANCFACRITIAVVWIKPDAPKREDRKEIPLLAGGSGACPGKAVELKKVVR